MLHFLRTGPVFPDQWPHRTQPAIAGIGGVATKTAPTIRTVGAVYLNTRTAGLLHLAHALDGPQLRHGLGQFDLGLGQIHVGRIVA